MGLITAGPLKPSGLSWANLALFQYNKISLCLLLNRPKTFFATLFFHGKQDAAVGAV